LLVIFFLISHNQKQKKMGEWENKEKRNKTKFKKKIRRQGHLWYDIIEQLNEKMRVQQIIFLAQFNILDSSDKYILPAVKAPVMMGT
jgi:hypothetical protein